MILGKNLFLIIIFMVMKPATSWCDEVKNKIEQPVEDSIAIMKQTQKDEEEWRRLQEKLTAELTALEAEVEHLRAEKSELETLVVQTRTRLAAKKKQLEDIRAIERDLKPFLEELLARIDSLPGEGIPFLLDERKKRSERLSVIFHDPEISISEKYRKIMEALQIEADFGITIETYQDTINGPHGELLVNIFRLGRLGLYYVYLDESGCGFYNIAEKTWQELPDSNIYGLLTAIAIADRLRPAELLTVPLGRLVKK